VILVTGATGNVGGALVRQLAADGTPVRGLVRRAGTDLGPGAEAVTGDLAQPAGLAGALDGVEALFLLGGFDTMAGVLERARAAGVARVVLLTSRCVIGGAPDNAITAMWLRSEAVLRESGLPATVLRPSGFQSNVLRWAGQWQGPGDAVRAPWPDAAIAASDPADIAAVAAVALRGDRYLGSALELSGPEALTPAAQVAAVAEALGRPLRYEPQPEPEARAELGRAMPEPFVDAQFRFFADGEYDDSRVVPTVREVTGREPGTLRAWLRHAAL
jgi:uncharacterized protein YbjT (DUF2867 family)